MSKNKFISNILFGVGFDLIPKAVHEGFLVGIQIVKDEKTVAVLVEGGLGPISRSCKQSLLVDVNELMMKELCALAEEDSNARFFQFVYGAGAGSKA